VIYIRYGCPLCEILYDEISKLLRAHDDIYIVGTRTDAGLALREDYPISIVPSAVLIGSNLPYVPLAIEGATGSIVLDRHGFHLLLAEREHGTRTTVQYITCEEEQDEMLDIIQSYNQLQREELRAREEHEALINAAKERVQAAEECVREAQAQVDKLEKQYWQLPRTGWVDGVVAPLAKMLAKRASLSWDIYGPFGLTSQTSIYLMEDKNKSITAQPTHSICLEPSQDGAGGLLICYQTGEYTNEYKPNSLGAINGMNAVKKPLPNTIKEIEALLQYSDSKGAAGGDADQ